VKIMHDRAIAKPFNRWLNAACALLAAACLSLAGCGGGSSSGSTLGASDGQAVVSLTDAAGDFLAYSVDVVSFKLTKQNGTVVNTLPQTTRVDFARLADLSELLTGAAVPAGNYTRVVMTLDYSNADIEVDDGTGQAVPATVKDRSGNAVTTLDVSVDFATNQPFVIVPGLPSQLEMDFNLAASNEVDMSNPSAPVVTVDPVLTAKLGFDQTRSHRVRGPLVSVDTGASTFTLALRPFHLLLGNFGQLTITTNANTVFEIDQIAYQGSAGLAQLDTKPAMTATIAVVTPNGAGQLIATEVYAGSSVAFGTSDVVSGNVMSRSGDVLTVRGASLARSDGTVTFHNTVQVQLGTNTRVTAQGSTTTGLNKDNLSVGQRISAFGTCSDASCTTLDATDPTKGPVRMLLTQLNGTVNGIAGQVLTMTLNRIDGRPIGLFNFAGTGTSVSFDADPNNYAVTLPIAITPTTSNGAPLKVRGFVTAFGQATATEDFVATTLIDVSSGPADLVVHWPILAQVTSPFTTFTAGGMVLDLSLSGLAHDVYRSGVDTTLARTVTPIVNALDPNLGLYVIGYHGTIQVYTTLSAFQSALQTRLNAGQYARAFTAHGAYADSGATLTATRMSILLR
jgi:hypothetical protein